MKFETLHIMNTCYCYFDLRDHENEDDYYKYFNECTNVGYVMQSEA